MDVCSRDVVMTNSAHNKKSARSSISVRFFPFAFSQSCSAFTGLASSTCLHTCAFVCHYKCYCILESCDAIISWNLYLAGEKARKIATCVLLNKVKSCRKSGLFKPDGSAYFSFSRWLKCGALYRWCLQLHTKRI